MRTTEALAAARKELEALCRQRVAAERRCKILAADLEGTRASGVEARLSAVQQRKDDADAVAAAKRALQLRRKSIEEERQQRQATLEALRRRKQTEESRVRALSNAFASTLSVLGREEAEAQERLDDLGRQADAMRVRAADREAEAKLRLEELETEKAAIETKPQLRKMLMPEPWRMGDDQIAMLEVPGTGANAMSIDVASAFGGRDSPSMQRSGESASAARPSSARPPSKDKPAADSKRPASAKGRKK